MSTDRDFNAYVAGLQVDEETKMLLTEWKGEKFVVHEHEGRRIAVDLAALNFDFDASHNGKKLYPKDLLQMYKDTGILVYKRPWDAGEDYQPITIIV